MYIKKPRTQAIPLRDIKKVSTWVLGALGLLFVWFCLEFYMPVNPFSGETVTYAVEEGASPGQIAKDLKELHVIRSSLFFKLYVTLSLKYHQLQAGKYSFSPRMSTHVIASKMADGDVIRNKVTIIEGWRISDMDAYLVQKGICTEGEFTQLASQDWTATYDFLADKPQKLSLEGYLFPDTYEFADGDTCQDIFKGILSTFGKRLTPELRAEIAAQKKSIFEIVTMASIIEKEVRTPEDKELVSGILWKRISIGMPLQVDASINYITGKSDPGAKIADTKIDSPYNTYKYPGLPKGPISNPGLESLLAAIHPKDSPYLFYLTDGVTHYSKTFEEHQEKRALYLD